MTKPEPSAPDAGRLETFAGADDAMLIAAFRAGTREAFDVIVVRHQRQVYQVCYRFMHNHEDAADLAQDVFVRAFKGLARFKGDASIGTWLYRIAVNACLNRVATKRAAVAPIEDAARVDARGPNALDGVLAVERADTVRRAIARLPPKQRATVTLRIYQECSHQEIASALGITVGAAKANLFHALASLRRILGRS